MLWNLKSFQYKCKIEVILNCLGKPVIYYSGLSRYKNHVYFLSGKVMISILMYWGLSKNQNHSLIFNKNMFEIYE